MESAGIIAVHDNVLQSVTGVGLVSDVFNESKLDQLPRDMAIGHAGGSSFDCDIEVPFFLRIVEACNKLEKAYSRDPFGFRPLVMGRWSNGAMVLLLRLVSST
ncbi:Amidophosphoribosyltransferase 2 [Forsythia ovata]|uniref:Amidophosphoribosyltransferase 2 n=1 Tax=Forsythia ovata TaxID=205694 RepID=A0ABD1S6I0_9LAMI